MICKGVQQNASDLQRIVAAWNTLPDHLKRAMLAMLG